MDMVLICAQSARIVSVEETILSKSCSEAKPYRAIFIQRCQGFVHLPLGPRRPIESHESFHVIPVGNNQEPNTFLQNFWACQLNPFLQRIWHLIMLDNSEGVQSANINCKPNNSNALFLDNKRRIFHSTLSLCSSGSAVARSIEAPPFWRNTTSTALQKSSFNWWGNA